MRYLLTVAVLVLALPAHASEVEKRCEEIGKIYGEYIQANFDGKPMEEVMEQTREMPDQLGRAHRQLIRNAYTMPRYNNNPQMQDQMKRTSVLVFTNGCIQQHQ